MDFADLTSAPLLFALTAGMVAIINPCGFVMLPALSRTSWVNARPVTNMSGWVSDYDGQPLSAWW